MEPVQNTIGVVRIKSSQLTGIGVGRLSLKKLIPTGEYRKIGTESSKEIKNLLRMSASIALAICGFVIAASWSAWLIFCMLWSARRSSFLSGGAETSEEVGINSMPQAGQRPGSNLRTCGCIGHVYTMSLGCGTLLFVG